jgi:hypothetical protein
MTPLASIRSARRGVAIACISAATILLSAAPASRGSGKIHECGNYGFTADGDGPKWTYRQLEGAGTYNVTSRVVRCRTARRVALHAYPGKRYRGWRCRYVSHAEEFADVRCTKRGGRVVRYQAGA